MRMSTKVYTLNICNKTTFTLYRYNHKIKHGSWITWLPEKINPSSSISISFTNSRSGHSYKSNLQYGIILDGILHLFEIKLSKSSDNDDFICSFKPLIKQNEVLNNNSFKLINNVPEKICKINTHVIDPNKANFIDSTETIYIINIEETSEGHHYLILLRNRFNTLISKLKQEYENFNINLFNGIELVNIYNKLSLDFIWDYNNLDWINTLRKSNISVLIRIVNLTSKEMRLGTNGIEMYKNCILDEGIWAEYPNEEIGKHCGTEFGCKSSGFLGGTSGRCIYSILGETGTFTFTWDRPSIGPFSANCKHSLNKYTVIIHTESSNHSTVIFHILDIFALPLQILTARAVSSRLLNKYQETKLSIKYNPNNNQINNHNNQLINNNNNNTDNNIDELLITSFLSKYQFPSSQNKSINSTENNSVNKDNQELTIKNPKHFFSSVNSTNINSPINKVSMDSNIYLEWMIGNEIFSKVFKNDEKIHINSSTVSGIADNKFIVLNSYLMRIDLSCLFYNNLYGNNNNNNTNDNINNNNIINNINNTKYNNNIDGIKRPYLKTMKHNELMDYVVMIFHCICDGFQPYINRCMTKKFGTNWLHSCKLPVGHIWKNQDSIRIDLEGIIYIVTAYWMEVFEQVLNETTHLNTIQTAAIYWANQELQRFDSNYVWDLLQSSKILLQKLKAEGSLKHLDFISNKLVQS